MQHKQVKVFNAYNAIDNDRLYNLTEDSILDLNNKILDKNNKVNKQFIPDNEDIIELTKYELDKEEKDVLSMLKNNIEQLEKLLDSSKRKYNRYKTTLINKLDIQDELYKGDFNICNLSPFNHCIYKLDESNELVCVFCGEPEDRK